MRHPKRPDDARRVPLRPRRPDAPGLASADSRLITPAPESALGDHRPVHGFPWRGTAAAVLTLAVIGGGVSFCSPAAGSAAS